MPRVSVIIPNYNHARYLRRRVESVLSQTFTDFDVLLMDDASTDDSRSIIDHYAADPRVRLLLNDKNSGSTFKQWNKGIAAVDGEYVWLAESDDYADPRFLERLVPLLEANSNISIAFCESFIVNADDAVLRKTSDDYRKLDQPDRWRSDFFVNGLVECAGPLMHQNVIPNASAVVFRRSTYHAVGGADESMRLCGDWKLWAMMLVESDLAHVGEPLNYFRFHAQNVRTSTKLWLTLLETIRVLQAIAAKVPVTPEVLEQQHVWMGVAYLDAWVNHTLPENPLRGEVFRELQAFDPHFRWRLICGAGGRVIRSITNGKAFYWTRRLLGGKSQ